ncbi:amino acid adenylation domain-containing protein [Micromonospora sp. NPDC049891]|uniref:amino acid adenylation domain-containing protein n=1 Tax=Micromonospora sp. NPDC049891 TaxID=3155655 RepID=UPI003405722C
MQDRDRPTTGGFVVVRNDELEFSIWPAETAPPAGWTSTGVAGSEDECLEHIGRTWTDMRPRSVRSPGPRPWHLDAERPPEVVAESSGARGPAVPIPDTGIADLIDRRNESFPDEIAIRFAGTTVTRAELARRTRRLAARLAALGAGPEKPVAVLLPRSADAVVAIVGVLRSGSPYLPISTADPVARLRMVLRDAGNPPVLTDDAGRAALAGYDGVVTLLDDDGEGDVPAEFPPVAGENLAYVAYTSGTSGPPKGVLGTHRQLVNYVRWCAEEFALEPGERALLHAPLYFVGSVMTLFTALVAGWELDVAPEPVAFDELRDQARQGRCGFLKLTPSHVRALTSIGDVASLARLYMIGSEPLVRTPALADWMAESPGSRYANHYGMSETCGATWYWIRGDEPIGDRLPVGAPIINAEVHVLGPDGQRLPYGEVGELCLAGAVVGRGYHGDPALTARRWRPHPWGRPGERLLHTGDLARMRPDGIVEVLGRSDRQVKIRGHRIALPTVEEAVLRCPGVAEAVVSVIPDSQEVPRLTALLRSAPGEQPSVGVIRERLLAELPEPWVPSHYLVTREFPLTPNGKIDYARLAGSRGIRPETAGTFREPATPEEKALCDIFADVLQLERVGADDNFRDLGGDSVNVVQAISLAQEAGVEVSISEFFEHASPRALAALARRPGPGAVAPVAAVTTSTVEVESVEPEADEPVVADPTGRIQRVPVPFSGPGRAAPLTWGQLHMWRPLQWYGAAFAALNITRFVDLGTPGAEIDICLAAVRRLAETYEPVRTRFVGTGDEPVQRVAANGDLQVEVLDAEPDEIDSSAQARATRLAAEPFDHARQWPVRLCLIRVEGRVRSIAVVASHLAFDGWSIERLTESLAGWVRGDSVALPDPVQPADEVAEERSPRGQRRSEQALAYWRERLTELPPVSVRPEVSRMDPPWQRWALWSADVATHAAELAARTRTSTSTVMVTLAAIATAALQRQDTVGLLLISGNRFTPRERRNAGPTVQDALVVHHGGDDRTLSETIKETYRTATEAYFNGRCDPIALAALRDEVGTTGRPDLSWYFNDARLGREWQPDPAAGPAGEPFLVRGIDYSDMTFCLGLAQRGAHCEVFLLADTAVLPPERIRHFLRTLSPLLSRALREELRVRDVAETLLGEPAEGS